jgi:hypothetical protein
MAIRKTGDAQKIDVAYFGEEAGIVNEHLQKVGKSVSDFSAEEKEALTKDLQAFRASNDEESVDNSEEPEADVANDKDEEE